MPRGASCCSASSTTRSPTGTPRRSAYAVSAASRPLRNCWSAMRGAQRQLTLQLDDARA
ncbi:Uncharacterised protein [Bordetella pertussis]|nr:Uncharacterised protein [Bordetella pertussis]